MTYLQSLQGQLVVFCRTVGFGFLLGGAYELLHFLRRLLRSRTALPWDIGFAVPSGVWFFLFALTQNGGKLRVHLLLALVLGMGICVLCTDAPCRRAAELLLCRTQRCRARLRALDRRLDEAGAKIRSPMQKKLKKVVKKNKFPLAIHPRHGV